MARRLKHARRVKTTVEFDRTQRVQGNGGWVDLPPEHVIIEGWLTHQSSLITQEASQAVVDTEQTRGWQFHYVTDGSDVNSIRAGVNNSDKFDVPGFGRFQVSALHPLVWHGRVYGITAELAEIR